MNRTRNLSAWQRHSLAEHDFINKKKQASQMANILVAVILIGAYGLITTGVLHINTDLTLFLLMGAVTYFISMVDPRYGLAAIIIAFSLSPELPVGGGLELRIEDFLIPMVAITWMFKSAGDNEKLTPSLLRKPFFTIAGVGMLASLIGLLLGKLQIFNAITYYLKSMEYMVLYFIAINILKTRQDVIHMLVVLLMASSFVALFGTYQAMTTGQTEGFRISGPEGETANILGGYYVFCMLLGAGLYFALKEFKYKALLFVYFGGIMMYPMLETFSRASFVSLLAAMTVVGVITKKRILVWVGVFMVIVPLLFPEDIYERMRTVLGLFEIGGEKMPSSFSEKVVGWGVLWDTNISQYLLLGTGVGSISLQVDNEYMKILGESGVIGLGCFIWMIVTTYKCAWAVYARGLKDFDKGLALGYMGAITALLFQGISGTVFTTMRTMEPFIVVSALITVLMKVMDDEKHLVVHGKKLPEDSTVPAIGHYTVTEIFKQRYRQKKETSL